MSFRKIIYFINPISGTKGKERLIQLIKFRTSRENIPFEILYTTKEGNYSFLQNKIAEEKITDVIICGGDGTINKITSFLLNTPVNVGVIPMGSGNGLAFAAGISRNPTKALDIIFKGKAKPVDGFFLNKHFSCMLSGLGFDAQVAHDFSQQKKRGLFTYILLSTKNFFTSKNYSFTIDVNEKKIHTKALFISIANSNQFGNNVTIAPQASLSDGLLDLVVVTKMNRLLTMFVLIKHLLQGKIEEHSDLVAGKKRVLYLQSKKITIQNPELAPLHIDGEPVDTEKNLEINVVENAFKLIQPS
jgi:YegS/Rv2252/BmrU family lipid kinase